MTALDNLNTLAGFYATDPELEVATVARNQADDGIADVRVLSLAGDAETFFRNAIKTAVVDEISGERWSLKPFDAIYKPEPDEVEWIDLAEVDAVVQAVDILSNLSAVTPFDPQDEGYKRRLLYASTVLTSSQGERAFFFRSFSAAAELKQKRGQAFVLRNGAFTRVEERIFVFDEAIDAFAFRDYLYIVRKRDYRRIFDQLAVLLARAKDAAQALHGKVPIANFADFEAACARDSRMADKILAVRERDYFNDLSYEMLEPVIDEFSLGIPSATVDGEVQLVFETAPNKRFRILKLVDDDYLASSMTNHRYEVNSKVAPPTA